VCRKMHLTAIFLLVAVVTVGIAVPIGNTNSQLSEAKPDNVVVDKEPVQIPGIVVDKVIVEEAPASAEVLGVASSGETTTLQPQAESGERTGRQVEDEDDEDGNADEDDDEEEDDGEEDEEEEERKLPAGKVGVKPGSKKKTPAVGKPVPVLVDGVEDDEAEDLGIFEREDVKSDEKSDEEKSEEDQHDEDDDESGEDDERSERPAGLVADPSSNERGDAYDTPASVPAQNEGVDSERPLAVAVVEREEGARDPEAVPVLVEDISTPSESRISQLGGEKVEKQRKNKPKKEADDDDEDDDDEEDEDEEEAARSEKVSQARAAAYPSPVLYYYPFPESPVPASTAN